MTYATRHPDLFAGVFSISGALNNIPLSVVGAIPDGLLAYANLPAVLNIDPANILGPFLSQSVLWHGRNPLTLANNLRPLKVWYVTGLGLIGLPGSEKPGDNPTTRLMEAAVGALNYEFNAKLLALDIPHTFDVNPIATHSGYYFLQWFKQALPVMQETFAANVGAPVSFEYQAIEASFDIFGWYFSTQRNVVEFLYLTDVSRDGLKLKGSGTVTVITPPVYAPGSLHWVVAPGQPGIDVWPNWPRRRRRPPLFQCEAGRLAPIPAVHRRTGGGRSRFARLLEKRDGANPLIRGGCDASGSKWRCFRPGPGAAALRFIPDNHRRAIQHKSSGSI